MTARKWPVLWSFAAGLIIVLGLVFTLAARVTAQIFDAPQRISFQISTGSTTSSHFAAGNLLAQVISHPPGIGRCEVEHACGPAGLIVSTRVAQTSVANVNAVNSGAVTSAIAQADVVGLAVAGEGPFRRTGAAKNIRVIANLYGEALNLVAAKKANIASVADLRGKRVSLSAEGMGTNVTARAVLAAYGLNERAIIANFDPAEKAADLLQAGELDAFFFVGGEPANLVQQLIDEDVAVLVPIDGAGRARLLSNQPYLSPYAIPEGSYANTPKIETVSVDALWITDAAQKEDVIYGILKALYNEANRTTLEAGAVGSHFLSQDLAITEAAAPLHPGAIRYFTEAGILSPDSASVGVPALADPPRPAL